MASEVLEKTILYLTDNSLEESLAIRCRELLVKVSCGLPIVSVSQEPIELGRNVCVGKIGRSGISMDRQILAGLGAMNTKWVSIAEHDCVYSEEHFRFMPNDDQYFWYNDNVWLAQLVYEKNPAYKGMFSYIKRRRVYSQLICTVNLLRQATEKRLELMCDPAWVDRYPAGRIGEPGSMNQKHAEKLADRLERHHVKGMKARLKDYVCGYGARDFNTVIPNLDIRHTTNFTGQRRGKRRCYELPYWGRLKDVLGMELATCNRSPQV